MPIEIEKLENRIYRAKWIGYVTLREILAGKIQRMAHEAGETYYVAILDATELKGLPFSVRGLRRGGVVYSRVLAILVVKSPLALKILTDIGNRLTKVRFEHYETMEEAFRRAKTILTEYEASQMQL